MPGIMQLIYCEILTLFDTSLFNGSVSANAFCFKVESLIFKLYNSRIYCISSSITNKFLEDMQYINDQYWVNII